MPLALGGLDKRRLARVLVVVTVALAAGHMVQTMAERKLQAQVRIAAAADESRPKEIVQLAATNEQLPAPAAPKSPLLAAAASAATVLPIAEPAAEAPAEGTAAPVPATDPVATASAVEVPATETPAASDPATSDPAAITTVSTDPAATPPAINASKVAALPPATPTVTADACPITLDVMADPGAMIGITLLAPCNPSERVVLRHAGLAITVATTATGSAFVTVPALETDALVVVRFDDGSEASASVTVPELATLRRFGVQWQNEDAFQVYGLEGMTTISATNVGTGPADGLPLAGGFLTRLGDASALTPLLAEIYTYPATGMADVVVEAAVTAATCGREILGETLASVAGRVTVTDLSLVMPDCEAVGDFLVLNNLASDLTLAAAN